MNDPLVWVAITNLVVVGMQLMTAMRLISAEKRLAEYEAVLARHIIVTHKTTEGK